MQRRKKKGAVAVTVIAALLILVAVVAFAVQCSRRNKPQDTPKPAMPELLFDCDHFVFGGGSAPAGQVPDPDSDPDPEPGEADFTLNAEELLYVPGGETSATLTATKAGVEWTAEWEDPASEWAGGKRTENYVRLTPSGRTVNIEFLAPFGERVKIVCSDGSGSRECLCGCLKTLESFQGYFRTWGSVSANSYFGYDTVTFMGPYLRINDDFERPDYGYTVEKASYYPYTEDQTLKWEIRESTYRLTEEFIASFRGYVAAQGEADGEVLAKVAGLRPDAETPVLVELQEDGVTNTVFCGCYYGMSSMVFPPLTEGLSDEAAEKMYTLFYGWHEAHGDETEVIEAVYRFTGSVRDCELRVRQRIYNGRERPEEYGQAS